MKETWPSAADLAVEDKPTPSIDILTSAVVSAEHNSAIETQRDTFAGRLARLCRYFDAKGMPGLECPSAR